MFRLGMLNEHEKIHNGVIQDCPDITFKSDDMAWLSGFAEAAYLIGKEVEGCSYEGMKMDAKLRAKYFEVLAEALERATVSE